MCECQAGLIKVIIIIIIIDVKVQTDRQTDRQTERHKHRSNEREKEKNSDLGSKHLTVQSKAAAIASSNVKSKLILQTATTS